MTIRPLEKEDMQKIIQERNKIMNTLRTPFMLNLNMQIEFFENVLSNRESKTRYWALINYLDKNACSCGSIGRIDKCGYHNSGDQKEFIGYGGLENIEFENRRAEISILIFENYRGKGYGKLGVDLILDQGFNYMNLDNIWGETYLCGNWEFWEKIIKEKNAFSVKLPARKYWNSKYYESLYFNFTKGNK